MLRNFKAVYSEVRGRYRYCVASISLIAIALSGCQSSATREPVGLRYIYSWNEDRPKTRALMEQFTRQTGILVKSIPNPQYTRNYVDLAAKLLKQDTGPDVLNIDLIWSPLLGPDLIDLHPHLANEVADIEPQLLPSYTVNGKLVAVPFNVPLGGLEYRADLLRQYGYDHPPRTWAELEQMAERIQAGERAKGRKDFWGYVWQGAAGEALTCNALEWQASAGGGHIIEADRTISVNNPVAIQSWERAARWIGRISPPSVVGYRELDSMLIFDSGKAAFNRIWLLTPITKSGQARQIGWRSSPSVVQTGFARMPGGAAGSAGTMGGTGTAVSARSPHRAEAIAFVKFQFRAQMRDSETPEPASASSQIDKTSLPSFPGSQMHGGAGIVSRPSVVTGSAYKQVSQAYIDAVYAVLTGKKAAAAAAGELERKLTTITGFRTGPPK